MEKIKTKYKKWDFVWVYWIFDNSIKKETENLESQLDMNKKIMKDLRETAKKIARWSHKIFRK